MSNIAMRDLNIFTVDLTIGKLEGIDNDVISQQVIACRDKRIAIDPCHTQYEDSFITDPSPELVKILDAMDSIARPKGLRLSAFYWAQSHAKHESTDIHNHFSYHEVIEFSWCYWARAKEGAGKLVFLLNDYGVQKSIDPTESYFVIFPAWLKHKVTKNLSDDFRVSVAGNFISKGLAYGDA